MAGHNKWTKIKHKKAAEDQNRGKLFSRLANEISIAARDGDDPQFNSALRSAVERARKQNMPQANIERAIQKASGSENLEDLLVEAYAPGGVGLIIEAKTDNRNRTMSELRSILKKHDSKAAEQGSLLWSFEKKGGKYIPKFPVKVPGDAGSLINAALDEIKNHPDVVSVHASTETGK